MNLAIKKWVYSKTTSSISAAIMTFFLWGCCFERRIIHRSYKIPVCFYEGGPSNVPTEIITAPAQISVVLSGRRSAFRLLDAEELAVHLNTDHLCEGKQKLVVDSDNLFLPSSIKLVDWSPQECFLLVQKGLKTKNKL